MKGGNLITFTSFSPSQDVWQQNSKTKIWGQVLNSGLQKQDAGVTSIIFTAVLTTRFQIMDIKNNLQR